MKRKLLGMFIATILIVIAIPQIEADENDFGTLPLNTGKAFFGWILINSSQVSGLPDVGYMGVLTDMNATFSGHTEFLLAKPFTPTMLETNNSVNVKIDFFWGMVEMEQENFVLMGFAKGISWEW